MTTTSTLPLIGIAGRKRHGKNRTADILKARLGYRSVAFADPLREMLDATNPVVGHEFVGPYKVMPIHWRDAIDALGYELAKDRYPELRRVMEDFGTGAVREVLGERHGLEELLGLSPWVAVAERRIEQAIDHMTTELEEDSAYLRFRRHWRELLAFTDVRFPNEADLIRAHGGIVVKVIRPALARPAEEHAAETSMDEYAADFVIVNDGTPRGLELAVEALIRDIA